MYTYTYIYIYIYIYIHLCPSEVDLESGVRLGGRRAGAAFARDGQDRLCAGLATKQALDLQLG